MKLLSINVVLLTIFMAAAATQQLVSATTVQQQHQQQQLEEIITKADKPLRIGVLPFPEHGHMHPVMPIMKYAEKRGHTVEVFGPQKTADFLTRDFPNIKMHPYSDKFEERVIETEPHVEILFTNILKKKPIESFAELEVVFRIYLDEIAEEIVRIFRGLPNNYFDVVLIDHGSVIGAPIADHLGGDTPVVMLWPMCLQLPNMLNVAYPGLGSSMSRHHSGVEGILPRFGSFLWRHVAYFAMMGKGTWMNELLAKHDIPPLATPDMVYTHYPQITPGLYGLDMTEPMPPNVFPVGFLFREALADSAEDEKDLAQLENWFENDCDSVFFWSLGSGSYLSDDIVERFEDAMILLSANTSKRYCNMWRVATPAQKYLRKRTAAPQQFEDWDRSQLTGGAERFLIRAWFHRPQRFLTHPKVKVFFTHCGAGSVYESLDSLLPMVGMPLFADQPDICTRITDAKIGLQVDKGTVTPEELAATVLEVDARNEEFRGNMRRIRDYGRTLGGAPKAVNIIETAAALPYMGQLLTPTHTLLPWWQIMDLDVWSIFFVLVALLLLLIRSVFRWCGGRRREKIKRD